VEAEATRNNPPIGGQAHQRHWKVVPVAVFTFHFNCFFLPECGARLGSHKHFRRERACSTAAQSENASLRRYRITHCGRSLRAPTQIVRARTVRRRAQLDIRAASRLQERTSARSGKSALHLVDSPFEYANLGLGDTGLPGIGSGLVARSRQDCTLVLHAR